jgi:hypothetical protein
MEAAMNTTTKLTEGDRIEAGKGEDRETGNVLAVDGDMVTVGWDSGVRTTQTVAELEALGLEVA